MNMVASSSISIRLRSARACFRRPEFGRDFVSYDVLPPLHAQRLLRTILNDSDSYAIDRINVLAPISWTWCSVETASGTRRVLALHEPEYRLDLRVRSGAATEPVSLVEDIVPHLGLKDFSAQATIMPTPAVTPRCGDAVDLGWLPVAMGSEQPRRTIYQRLYMHGGVIDLFDQDEEMRAR